MEKIDFGQLVYDLKEAKKAGKAPIFFLGAGASMTAGIPRASQIIADAFAEFNDNPGLQKLSDVEKKYAKVMSVLKPNQRKKLFDRYIADAKVNVTHIYLAQLMQAGYADYVLTVNFDNLMLRALALYNEFPPVYDMAIIKERTTDIFPTKSVIYLHGQHHSDWLLNTPEEMAKVKESVLRVFDTIKHGRPWVFIGYSGSDPVFDNIQKIAARFNEGLYWVGNNSKPLPDKVAAFLSTTNLNAFHVEGYDADSFMLTLSRELGVAQPQILDKPFTALLGMLNNIVDIDDAEHFKGVKDRLEIVKEQVEAAIKDYENDQSEQKNETRKNSVIKLQLIKLLIDNDYSDEGKVEQLLSKVKALKNPEFESPLSSAYYNWGVELSKLSDSKMGAEQEGLLRQAIEKYEQAIAIKPNMHEAYGNWGHALSELAASKTSVEAEDLLKQAIKKYEQAVTIKPDKYNTYSNWGVALSDLAESKTGVEAEGLLKQAIEKYEQSVTIKPNYDAYYNWGLALSELADSKAGFEAERLLLAAIEKYEQSVTINSSKYDAYSNWGIALSKLSLIKAGVAAESVLKQASEKFEQSVAIKPNDDAYYNWGVALSLSALSKTGVEAESLWLAATEKYEQAITIKPDKYGIYNNWGNALLQFAKSKTGAEAEDLLRQACRILEKGVELGGDVYNLACCYALLGQKTDALRYLDISLSKHEITLEHVRQDDDWKNLQQDEAFLAVLSKYQ
jgi:tetratricopeptide (TPR) repeat protein